MSLEKTQQSDVEFDNLFKQHEKYNSSVNLTEDDIKAGTKIYCKESYAQDLYDAMKSYEASSGISLASNKDLNVGEIYDVVANQVSFTETYIKVTEVNSKTEILIPFKEFTPSIESLTKGEGLEFKVMVIKSNTSGQFIGSEKRCASITHKEDLFKHQENNTWFKVKINKLIKGGYVASYNDSIDCFIPGSHAAANIIRDFSKLLDKEIYVMVDNYDQANNLFILSYKKYVKHSMSERITELRFGKKYNGTLTTRPYDFGMFVEIDGYFTGLLHSSEFDDYENVKKFYKAGDTVDFYIKNVTKKGKEFRVVLTLDPDEIDFEKRKWDDIKTKGEGNTFEYEIDLDNNSISIDLDGEYFDVKLRRQDLQNNLDAFPRVKVQSVDPINRNVQFEFVK